jgi:hypothetical protein
LHDALQETTRPTIVCAQAGNINTGAIDPLAGSDAPMFVKPLAVLSRLVA